LVQRLLLIIVPGLVGTDRQHQQRQRDVILRINDPVKAAEYALQYVGGWRDSSQDALTSVELVLLKCLSSLDVMDTVHAPLRHAIEFKYHLVMIYKELCSSHGVTPSVLALEPMLRSWQDLETYCDNDLAAVVGLLISSKWKRSNIANKVTYIVFFSLHIVQSIDLLRYHESQLFQLYSHQARVEQPSAANASSSSTAAAPLGRVVRTKPENALAHQLEAAALAELLSASSTSKDRMAALKRLQDLGDK
jgi:hypothetical protein